MSNQEQWPADTVRRAKVASLVPSARNARKHSAEQIDQLVTSIREWGWTMPVLVDEAGGIIAGHGRVLAAAKLGIDDVPVMTAEGWSDEKKRAYMLADNKLALNSGWDNKLLAAELTDLKALETVDLSMLGFSASELTSLLPKPAYDPAEDEVPEPPKWVTTVLGDVWLLGKHRLVCGDCTDPEVIAKALPSGAIAACLVTSPPYWAKQAYDDTPGRVGAAAFCLRVSQAWASRVRRRMIINTGNTAETSIDEKGRPGVRVMLDAMWVHAMEEAGWSLRSRRIWVKGGPTRHTAPHLDPVDQSCEAILTFWRVGKSEGGQERTGEPWALKGYFDDIKGVGKDVVGDDHPCPFPVEIPRRFFRLYSQAGDTVAEPFCGSGTSLIAGQTTDRHVAATELSPAYVDVSVLRWQTFTGMSATLEATGETFEMVAAKRATAPAVAS